MLNIVDVVAADKNLVALSKGMKAAGLNVQLSELGPFTIFAPTDMAFGKLQTGEWPKLLKPENRVSLVKTMIQYVIKGKMYFKDLTDGQSLRTIGGKELKVSVNNYETVIDGAKIQGRDMEASNGIVHTLDRLIS